eukprot:scaffold4255_cov85-Isochrysis_galbana.AAC.3
MPARCGSLVGPSRTSPRSSPWPWRKVPYAKTRVSRQPGSAAALGSTHRRSSEPLNDSVQSPPTESSPMAHSVAGASGISRGSASVCAAPAAIEHRRPSVAAAAKQRARFPHRPESTASTASGRQSWRSRAAAARAATTSSRSFGGRQASNRAVHPVAYEQRDHHFPRKRQQQLRRRLTARGTRPLHVLISRLQARRRRRLRRSRHGHGLADRERLGARHGQVEGRGPNISHLPSRFSSQ